MLSPKRGRSSICLRPARLQGLRLVGDKLPELARRQLRPWIAQRPVTIAANPKKITVPRDVRLETRGANVWAAAFHVNSRLLSAIVGDVVAINVLTFWFVPFNWAVIRFNPGLRVKLIYPTTLTEYTCARDEAIPAAPSAAARSSDFVLMIFTMFYSVCGVNFSEPPVCVNVFLNKISGRFARRFTLQAKSLEFVESA